MTRVWCPSSGHWFSVKHQAWHAFWWLLFFPWNLLEAQSNELVSQEFSVVSWQFSAMNLSPSLVIQDCSILGNTSWRKTKQAMEPDFEEVPLLCLQKKKKEMKIKHLWTHEWLTQRQSKEDLALLDFVVVFLLGIPHLHIHILLGAEAMAKSPVSMQSYLSSWNSRW